MSYYVDTHCHLDLFPTIINRVDEHDSQPIKTITVTNSPKFWNPNINLFKECKNIRVALGLHPELAAERLGELSIFESHVSKTRYIGEIGLDGASKNLAVRNNQLYAFTAILKMLRNQSPKILTIHSRAASDETVGELIKHLKGSDHSAILHWYSGGREPLQRAINSGFFFSVNHKMVSSKNGIDLLKFIPINQILTETDAPFTFTSKITNREDSLRETILGLSRIWGKEYIETKNTIYENFFRLVSNP
jgi:TatD DNase family protein